MVLLDVSEHSSSESAGLSANGPLRRPSLRLLLATPPGIWRCLRQRSPRPAGHGHLVEDLLDDVHAGGVEGVVFQAGQVLKRQLLRRFEVGVLGVQLVGLELDVWHPWLGVGLVRLVLLNGLQLPVGLA